MSKIRLESDDSDSDVYGGVEDVEWNARPAFSTLDPCTWNLKLVTTVES